MDRQDDNWLEEVIESYIKEEEESKIQKERRNETTNGDKNIIKEMYVIRSGDLSRYREERLKGQNMRKIQNNFSKKKIMKKREVKRNNDQNFNFYQCLCPPGYHGIHCQTG